MSADGKLNRVEAKAVRLAAHGHCHKLPQPVAVYSVASEHHTFAFTIVLHPDGSMCSCEAGQRGKRCSHVIACELLERYAAEQERAQAREAAREAGFVISNPFEQTFPVSRPVAA